MSALLKAIAWHWDEYDVFGSVQEWRFALCNYLHWQQGITVEGFQPGIWPDFDGYAYNYLSDKAPSIEESQHALKVLDRYREWVRLAGKDY